MSTYNAAEVDPLLQDLWAMSEDAVKLAKDTEARAKKAEARVAELEAEKVTLEKVAASKAVALDATRIDACLDTLQDLAFLQPGAREKIASQLVANPNSVFDLIAEVAQLSLPAPVSGAGLSKSASRNGASTGASAKADDPDDWGKIAREGA